MATKKGRAKAPAPSSPALVRFTSAFVLEALSMNAVFVDFKGHEFIEGALRALQQEAGERTVREEERGVLISVRNRSVAELERLADWAVRVALLEPSGRLAEDDWALRLSEELIESDSRTRSHGGDHGPWDDALGFFDFWLELADESLYKVPFSAADLALLPAPPLAAIPGNLIAALGLAKLDHACRRWDSNDALGAACGLGIAWECAAIAVRLNEAYVTDCFESFSATAKARFLARARHEKSPQSEAKRQVKGRWQEWQDGTTAFDSDTAFAEAMVDEFRTVLRSVRVITGWCTSWKREQNTTTLRAD